MNFRSRSSDGVEINLAPLIDVVFILLIFFMVTTTFNRESELKINLPEATAESNPQEDMLLELIIDASGGYYINGKAVVNSQAVTLIGALKKALAEQENVSMTIRADARVAHQSVVTAMDSAAKLGINRISIATTNNNGSSQKTPIGVK
jgi:biopolymer transport protein ExbD